MEDQIFENFRYLLDHQQSIIHAALIASGILLAGAAWCATHDRPHWLPFVALAGLAVNACLLVPAIRSCQLYETTLDYVITTRPRLLDPMDYNPNSQLEIIEQYAGATGGWSPVIAVVGLGGAWVLLLAGLGLTRLLRALSQWMSLEYPRRT